MRVRVMIRRVINLVCLVSALMFVALVVLIVLPIHVSVTGWEVFSEQGVLSLWRYGRHPWHAVWNSGDTFLLWAVLPVCWLVGRQVARDVRKAREAARRAAARKGVCFRCGYDLRATPGRCPECGTVPGVGEESGRGAASNGGEGSGMKGG